VPGAGEASAFELPLVTGYQFRIGLAVENLSGPCVRSDQLGWCEIANRQLMPVGRGLPAERAAVRRFTWNQSRETKAERGCHDSNVTYRRAPNRHSESHSLYNSHELVV